MSMEQQIAMMDAKGVDKAVILPLANPETPAETQSWGEILSICERYPGRFIPFCNIDPRIPRRPDLITANDFLAILNQCRELGFKGIGEVTARIPWDDPSLDKLFAAPSGMLAGAQLPVTGAGASCAAERSMRGAARPDFGSETATPVRAAP